MQQQPTRVPLKSVETTPATLPEHREAQVMAGLKTYQSVLAERDTLERQLRDAVVKIDSLDQQLSAMQGVVNLMESAFQSSKAELEGRLREYMQQRDHAVAKAATLEAHLVNIQSTLNNALVNA